MPKRLVKPHTRCRKSSAKKKSQCFPVTFYIQEYDKPRSTPAKKKLLEKPNKKEMTYWLKDERGYFTGRADSSGDTTSTDHVSAGKDFTNNKRGRKMGRIYGRYNNKVGKKLLKTKNKKRPS